jgi:hypothetical protein
MGGSSGTVPLLPRIEIYKDTKHPEINGCFFNLKNL